MELALVLLALAGPCVALAVVAVRRERASVRDDLLRAGDGPEVSARDAALAAGGRSAWMRIGGSGG